MYKEEVTDRKKEPMRVREGSTGCTANGADTDHCQTCDVTIGDKTYCSQCEANYVPIDGTCVLASGQDAKCTTNDSNGACTQCGAGYFLHKGGCYAQATAPGNIICQTAGNTAGVCETCNADNGYFTNPEAANNVDSCISCDDTTGVTIGENDSAKTYKGVNGCKTCTISGSATTATCKECAAGFLHTPSEGATSCVETCPEGYFGHTDNNQKKTCQSCSTESGLNLSVTGIEGCTSCTYTSSTLKCTACGEGKKPNKEGTGCFDCGISGCAYCSEAGKCEACGDGYRLEGGTCAPVGGNLSTGAIAGISVAVIVVVGGLVGFLCWWFVCRGKA